MDRMRQWPWAVLAFVMTTALLFGAHALYVQHAEEAPFLTAARRVPGVRGVRVQAKAHVDVWLWGWGHPSVVYPAVSALANQDLGQHTDVRLMDNPTRAQTALERQLALLVAEAEARGNYPAMAQRAEHLAAAHHEALVFTVGPHNIFVSVSDGAHRLFLVYPLRWILPAS